MFVELHTADCTVGGAGRGGKRNGVDEPSIQDELVNAGHIIGNYFEPDITVDLPQMPSEKKFWAVFGVATGKQQAFDFRIFPKNTHHIPQFHLLHAKVTGVNFFSMTALYHVANAYSPLF